MNIKTSLVVILLTGLVAGFADASPSRSLRQRKIEKKRDANQAQAAAQAKLPPAVSPSASPPAASGPASPSPAAPAAAAAPPEAAAAAPTPAPRPSMLTRTNKPPNGRFFSKVRTDASRNRAKARQAAAAQAPAKSPATARKSLIYRDTWGARARNRHR